MKKQFLLLALMWISILSFPQSKNFEFSIMAGGTFPLGSFRDKDSVNANSCFAKPGIQYGLEISYKKPSKMLGLSCLMINQYNNLDNNAISKNISYHLWSNQYTNTHDQISVNNSQSWSIQKFLIGPYLGTRIYESSFFINLRLLLGLSSVKVPEIKAYDAQQPTTISVLRKSTSFITYSHLFELKFGYYFNSNTFISMDINNGFINTPQKQTYPDILINGILDKRPFLGISSINDLSVKVGIGIRI